MEEKEQDGSKKKKRGQNKSRPLFKEIREDKLCRALIDGLPGPCKFDKCSFVHDVARFLEDKPTDLGSSCYNFTLNGYCSSGLACRYARCHLTDDNINMGVEVKDSIKLTTFNQIDQDLIHELRKKKHNFSRADAIVKASASNATKNGNPKEAGELKAVEKPMGSVTDEDLIKPRPEEKKTIDFRNKLFLSPLTTVGNLPFRRICKEYGVDVTCGEMACAVPLINGAIQEWALTKRHESEDIFGVQICGHKPNLIAYATQLLDERFNVDFVDLNIGCPIDMIYQQGGGSALMRRQNVLEEIVRSCSTLLQDKPFTVKTRTGIYADKSVAHDLLPKFEKWGASLVTVSDSPDILPS